ncbi:MAG: MBG domain-containing protein [Cytophagales bacterium]|nr:MBG domain-containing protein [Cytophagales bacterium]
MREILLTLCILCSTPIALLAQCSDPVFTVDEDFENVSGSIPDCWIRAANSSVSDNDVAVVNGQLRISVFFQGRAVMPSVENLTGIITFDAEAENILPSEMLTMQLMATDDGSQWDVLTSFQVGTTSQSYTYDLKDANYTGNYTRLGFTYQFTQQVVSSSLLIDNVLYTSECTDPNPTVTAVTKNITVMLDQDGEATIAPEDVDNGSKDACDNLPTLSLDKTLFTCADLGNNTVTLTATIGSSSDTETANVRVIPELPDNNEVIPVYLPASGMLTVVASDLVNSNCTDVTYTLDPQSQNTFDCNHVGSSIQNSIKATWGNGADSHSHSITLMPLDTISPVLDLMDGAVTLDGTGNATVSAALFDTGSTSSCGLTLSLSKSQFTYDDIGVNTITVTGVDASGNSSSGNVQLTVQSGLVEFNAAPALPAPYCIDGATAFDINLDGSVNGSTYYLIDTLDNSIVDGPVLGTGNALTFSTGILSGPKTFEVAEETAFTSIDQGSAFTFVGSGEYADGNGNWRFNYANGYTFEATIDDFKGVSSNNNVLFSIGNSGDSDIEAYIQQNTGYLVILHERNGGLNFERYPAPAFNTKTHIAIVYAPNGSQFMSVYYDGALISKIGGGINNSLGVNSNYVFKVGEINHTAFGSTSISDLTIDEVRVWDAPRTAATIQSLMNTCVDETSQGLMHYYRLDEGAGTVASDLSGSLDLTLINPLANANNWAAPGSGLVACSVDVLVPISNDVTIGDITAPTVVLQDVTLSLDATGKATLAPADADNGSSDDCTPASELTFVADLTDFSCHDLGDNTVTITVTDKVGNAASRTIIVTVVDDVAPVFSANNPNGLSPLRFAIDPSSSNAVTFAVSDLRTSVRDNCDRNPTVTLSQSSFTCSDLGSQTITLTATDASGNTSTATEIIEIVDETIPTAVTQDATIALDDNGVATIAADEINNGSTDNCTATGDLILSLSRTSFSCEDLGANTVILSVSDASGNETTASAIVTVVDNIAPVAFAKNITVDAGETLLPSDIDDGSSDNCSVTLSLDQNVFNTPGSYTVTLTATDPAGNTATAMSTVTVLEVRTAQSIAFSPTTSSVYGEVVTLSATATSQLPVVFTVSTGPGTISNGNTLTLTGVGHVTIVASQEGNDSFSAAQEVTRVIEVSKALLSVVIDNQSITFGAALPTYSFSYQGFVLGDGQTSLDVTPIVGSTATAASEVGTYPITATTLGTDDSYELQYQDGVLTINKADQTIDFDDIADLDLSVTNFVTLAATASSDLAVTYTLSQGDGSISGNALTVNRIGDFTVVATQVGNSNYNEATATQSFTVIDSRKTDQVITFNGVSDRVYGDVVALSATASSSLPVTFQLVSGTGSLDGNILTIRGVGNFEVVASQGGDAIHNPASAVHQQFTVNKAPLTATAVDVEINLGDILPNFEISYSGFKLNETVAVLDQQPTAFVDASVGTDPGEFPIQLVEGNDDHYEIGLQPGLLTIVESVLSSSLEIPLTSKVYPNPATEKFIFEWSGTGIVVLNVVTMRGEKQWTSKPFTGSLDVDVSAWSSGVYYVQLFDQGNLMGTYKLFVK